MMTGYESGQQVNGGKNLCVAFLTSAAHYHFCFGGREPFWQFDERHTNIIQTSGVTTNRANKMYVMIMVMSRRTVVTAQCVLNKIIRGGDIVNNPFVEKCLQRAINRYTIKQFTDLFFDVSM